MLAKFATWSVFCLSTAAPPHLTPELRLMSPTRPVVVFSFQKFLIAVSANFLIDLDFLNF